MHVELFFFSITACYFMAGKYQGVFSDFPLSQGFPGCSDSKESACNAGDLGLEVLLEEGMATHCSIIAWRVP